MITIHDVIDIRGASPADRLRLKRKLQRHFVVLRPDEATPAQYTGLYYHHLGGWSGGFTTVFTVHWAEIIQRRLPW